MSAIGAPHASKRMLVLAGLVAPLLGGCVSTMDHPVDRSFADQITRAEPAASEAIAEKPVDDGEWRLRLSYL
ncbi:hypothetical protein MMSR116_12025 [Methylobacterium mesophilicum SR1.6/6]|uniref:Uncharacterized protein n=1 Tax=Methylobacterium mesophilicum SR1.6/6 TaxID=908290 RepID=A0A6B9FNG9_9HYPH|nr:hypothetical protein [Methylobacterium mesophilicum]QGY02518.1 hypothetical protein MMSR116_12025 [Methylobacterium mesophilicum SR1.6/6]